MSIAESVRILGQSKSSCFHDDDVEEGSDCRRRGRAALPVLVEEDACYGDTAHRANVVTAMRCGPALRDHSTLEVAELHGPFTTCEDVPRALAGVGGPAQNEGAASGRCSAIERQPRRHEDAHEPRAQEATTQFHEEDEKRQVESRQGLAIQTCSEREVSPGHERPVSICRYQQINPGRLF